MNIFHKVKRIVVKVGTNLIADESGRLDKGHLENLVNQIADLSDRGFQILLVTSGAIAAGVEGLNLEKRALLQGQQMYRYTKYLQKLPIG